MKWLCQGHMSINGITGSEIRSDSKFCVSVSTHEHTHKKAWSKKTYCQIILTSLLYLTKVAVPSWKYRLATEHSANSVKHPRTMMESHDISQLGGLYSLIVAFKCIQDKSENGWCQLYLYKYWNCGRYTRNQIIACFKKFVHLRIWVMDTWNS